MKNKSHFTFIGLFYVLLPFFSMAQQQAGNTPKVNNGTNKKGGSFLKIANSNFKNLRYAYAIPFYKSYLKHQPSDTAALVKLASCYKLNLQPDSAVKYYENAVLLGASVKNNLAELYAIKANYTKAITTYKNLISTTSSSAEKNWYNRRLNGFTDIDVYFKDSLNYNLHYLKINTSFNEFNAVPYGKGLVFESNKAAKLNRSNEFAWDGTSYTKLYNILDVSYFDKDTVVNNYWEEKQLKRNNTNYLVETANDNNKLFPGFSYKKLNEKPTNIPLFSDAINNNLNYGAITFTVDGNTAYFTRNNKTSKGIINLEICEARLLAGVWTVQRKLSFNNSQYSYYHPAVTPDGRKIYFSSDQPGGMGGSDIYYVEKKNDGTWGQITNMPGINTQGNELFPTFYDNTLYFSSNGYEGLGGLDIYKLNLNGTVENLGYPVNTSRDEFGFSIKNNQGYFTSSRYGSDDIFAFTYKPVLIKIDGVITINPDHLTTVTLQNLLVKVYGTENDKLLETAAVDIKGNYSFNVKPNGTFTIVAETQNGQQEKVSFTANNYVKKYDPVTRLSYYNKNAPGISINVPVPIVDNGALKKYNLYYDLNKATLTGAGKVVLDSLVNNLNANLKLNAVMGSFTDCVGDENYNMALSARRSDAVINYLKNKGIIAARIIQSNYGENYLVQPCATNSYNKLMQLINRRTEIYVTDLNSKKWDELYRESLKGK